MVGSVLLLVAEVEFNGCTEWDIFGQFDGKSHGHSVGLERLAQGKALRGLSPLQLHCPAQALGPGVWLP